MTAGTIPSLTSLKANCASGSATTMSQQATSPHPPPSACPCTSATTGAAQPSIASSIVRSRSASATFSSKPRSTDERIHSTSAPAENDGPSPVSSTARTSEPIPANAPVSSSISAASNAFRRSGRAIAMRSREPSRSTRTTLIRTRARAGLERPVRLVAATDDHIDLFLAGVHLVVLVHGRTLTPCLGHMRKMPNCVSAIGAFSAALMPSARTRRVSRGSMMPSSQRRAVE